MSTIAEKLGSGSGINELMRDLGESTGGRSDLIMLGGGNPAHIPAMEKLWRARWMEIAANGDELERVLGNYDGPHGSGMFIDALATFLRATYGWDISARNIAVVNGSQNAFFYLFNMLAGRHADGTRRTILFPLSPEYIGYADQGLEEGMFRCFPPAVELIGDRRFKYHIDFDRLVVGPDVAAICVSRPTNPTGNVLTNREIEQLDALAAEHGIPLIIDNAYGAPFPDIIFNAVDPFWSESSILVMSLSKLGLPGTRTGIIIAREDIIETVSAMHAVVGLANGNIGQAIAAPLIADGSLCRMCRDHIRPFYEQRSGRAAAGLEAALGADIPVRIHVSEGALFLWLWFDNLPGGSAELYRRLKRRNVVVVPGHYFFYGLEEPHPHQDACIRVSYAQDADVVDRGIAIIAEEVRRLYGKP